MCIKTTVICRNKTPLADDFVRKGILFPHFPLFSRVISSYILAGEGGGISENFVDSIFPHRAVILG